MVSKDFGIIAIIIVIVIVIIFMFIKIQKLSKNNIKENFSSDDLAKVRTEINKIYDMDVEAIRNLGHISKSLLTGTNYHSTDPGTPGDLTIPADNTKFKGNVVVDGGITMGHSQIIYTPSGNMHLHGEEELYLLNKKGVRISDTLGGNGNLTVDGNINMSTGRCSNDLYVDGHFIIKGLVNPLIGVGQSWHDVTGVRFITTEYTNDTDKPITVNISVFTSGWSQSDRDEQYYHLIVNDMIIAQVGVAGGMGAPYSCMTGIVPPDARYKIVSVGNVHGIKRWVELR